MMKQSVIGEQEQAQADLVDTHLHLDAPAFAEDRKQLLEAARSQGVKAFVVPSVDAASCAAVAVLTQEYTEAFPAYGIHPLYANHASEAELAGLAQRLSGADVVAVGEIGLDYFDVSVPPARQVEVFVAQLKLARRYELPVIIHSRRAVDDILKYLRLIPVVGGIAHAFNGSWQQAQRLMAMGFKLGFGGAMTFTGSRRIRELASRLPLETIVLETDAPDMAPAWVGKGRNEPVNLFRYAQVLAQLRQIPFTEVAAATSENARQVLLRLAAG